eukprot:139466-Pelagomonas_calceolata.AAC.3
MAGSMQKLADFGPQIAPSGTFPAYVKAQTHCCMQVLIVLYGMVSKHFLVEPEMQVHAHMGALRAPYEALLSAAVRGLNRSSGSGKNQRTHVWLMPLILLRAWPFHASRGWFSPKVQGGQGKYKTVSEADQTVSLVRVSQERPL